MLSLQPVTRRITYVIIFELIAIVLSSMILSGMSDRQVTDSLPVAVGVSLIAVVWNYAYNTLFESWERKNGITSRSVTLRVAHTVLFEAGFIVLAVPLFMWWYEVSFVTAFMMELGILVFFLVYTFVFTWLFDKIVPTAASQQ
ncbi:PACE efflux transporter [Siccibacter colletis]|uniref:PACE efflux transporter n=1 Tax=Siccibacter colletis TaxID=1505757 RepID=UPI0028BF5310|nr:PACE efflux transporter [Siccibacter colletis]WNN50134.1 PACE efflux transporter [Siccibacter colletis]